MSGRRVLAKASESELYLNASSWRPCTRSSTLTDIAKIFTNISIVIINNTHIITNITTARLPRAWSQARQLNPHCPCNSKTRKA